jgi:hypothetical protein
MSITTLTDVRPQSQNANAHTPRGMRELEESIQRDGWIGAITVAADGETFDGSARVEIGAATFGDVEPIVIESDGSRPIIHVRTDIPSARDPRALRLGIAANKIAADNLAWDNDALAAIAAEVDLGRLFNDEEWASLGIGDPQSKPEPELEDNYQEQYGVIVLCANAAEQEEIYNRLLEQGYTCKVVVT